MGNKVLLIGNGPSATSMKIGREIDEFDGKIVRFNTYWIEGYEEYVGTRTDIWITCNFHEKWWRDYEKVYVVNYARGRDDRILNRLKTKYPDCEDLPEWAWQFTLDTLGKVWACSSGAVTAAYFQRDYETYIYGFDFFCADKHHYGDRRNDCHHIAADEKKYFGKLLRQGRIIPFQDYLRKTGYNIFEEGIEKEKDKYDWIYDGGCPGYGTRNHGYHTYPLIKELAPKTLLDIGCGKGQYVEWCRKQGIDAVGVDFASGYGVKADVTKLPYDDNSFDVVTAFDLFEHLKYEDLDKGISEALRVADDRLIVSIGYGKSNIKTPDGMINLHPINDKDEQWWFDKFGRFGHTELWGKDFYNHPFIVVKL